MTKSAIALLGAIAGVAAVDNALWRMECPSRVGLARLDPIINPGEMSKHVHAIHGSGGKSRTLSVGYGIVATVACASANSRSHGGRSR